MLNVYNSLLGIDRGRGQIGPKLAEFFCRFHWISPEFFSVKTYTVLQNFTDIKKSRWLAAMPHALYLNYILGNVVYRVKYNQKLFFC